ncbi:hypothetical protein V502_03827 [Pseudogymnoascus sp. VKM F-4520 (FW-2644)]|nr:hypothetical protein V502_03827 [Pseudogymnoascus sp. VKM F-4520 (FW-2644)]
MSHNEIWDDSALVDSWNEALEEYKHYHSLHARGETVEDAIADHEKESNSKDAERITREDGAPDETEDGMVIEDSEGPRARKGDANASAQQEHKANDKVSLGEGDGQSTTKPNGGPSSAQPPLPQHLIGAVGDENMKNLLMSWYYAGYYTGLYEGQQKVKPADEGKLADVVSFKVVPLALEPPAPRELKRDPRQFSDAKRRASPHFPKAAGLVEFGLHVLCSISQCDMPIPGIVQTSRPWPDEVLAVRMGYRRFAPAPKP